MTFPNNKTSGTKKRRSKKKCPHGSSCKFIHEYQHQLEFSHDNEAPKPSFEPFAGLGQAIATTEQRLPQQSKPKIPIKPPPIPSNTELIDLCDSDSDDDVIPIAVVTRKRPRPMPKSDDLPGLQEQQSVLQKQLDLQREQELQLSQASIQSSKEHSRQKEICKLSSESEQIQRKEQKSEQNLVELDPEPIEGAKDVITVAFKLPRKCTTQRIIRRFHYTATGEQLDLFLQSRANDELLGVHKWQICQVTNHAKIDSETRLVDLDLFPRGLVIVKELENDQLDWL